MILTDVTVLIPGICEHVALHGSRDFAHMVKDEEHKMRLFWKIWVDSL